MQPVSEAENAKKSTVKTRSILVPGRNCCAVSKAHHAAVLIDGAAYFAALHSSLGRARKSIIIVGWDFDASTCLRPQDGSQAQPLGDLLRGLVEKHPDLHIRILIWSLATLHAPSAVRPLLFGADWAAHERIHLHLDTHHPAYASHHQKMVIIDDAVAFIGGMDLTVERWDRSGHALDDSLRRRPNGRSYEPVHDVQMVLDGPVVCDLAIIALERWRDATGETLSPQRCGDCWPAAVAPDFADVSVAISRTQPRFKGQSEVEEAAKLTDDLMREGQKAIYIETQYFTGQRVGRLVEDLLARPEGPQIAVICTRVANGMVERFIMGANRERLLRRLKAADRYDRLRVYYPVADNEELHRLLIHSKVMIVDDRFLRIGSANLNNRSVGLDTECDVTIIAQTSHQRQTILRLRDTLLAEHLGVTTDTMHQAGARGECLLEAIESRIHEGHSLRPMIVTRGATRPVPGTFILDPERPFRFTGALYAVWSRLAGRLSARAKISSEKPSVTKPRQRGMRK
ncbi:phospholipase D-like domain-containing protein [Roseovarius sp. B08]|uniref:phospholipase D-like domain-containing protein n=1 Tax=Roseovarius sp. B08 TaxID=3449223 RepID=UPI003EDB7065